MPRVDRTGIRWNAATVLIVRVATEEGPRHGIVRGESVHLVRGLADPHPTGDLLPLGTADLLAPLIPGTIFGMAHNTGSSDRMLPPQAFMKPFGTVIGPGDPIPVPAGVGRVVAEAELALVIGASGRHRTLQDALDIVLGFTATNDVTARDLQAEDSLWLAGKGFDGFTPLGPGIQTDLPSAADIVLSINGDVVSRASTAGLARGFAEIIVYLSAITTLRPGDVILTGAPGSDHPLQPGDVASIAVGGLPPLRNPVVESPAPSGLLDYYRKEYA